MKTKMMKSIATLMLSITVATTMACSNPVEENADEETSSASENTESDLDMSENTATDNTEKSNDITITISKEHNDENVRAYGSYASCDTSEFTTDEDTAVFINELDIMLGKAMDNFGDTQATYDDFAVLHDKYLKPSADPNDPEKWQEVMIYSTWDEEVNHPGRGITCYTYSSIEDPNHNNVPVCDHLSLTNEEYAKNGKFDADTAVKEHHNGAYVVKYAYPYIYEDIGVFSEEEEIEVPVYFGHSINEGIEMLNTSDERAIMYVPLFADDGTMMGIAIFNNVPSRFLK